MKRFYIIVDGTVQTVLGSHPVVGLHTMEGVVRCGTYGERHVGVDVWTNKESAQAELDKRVLRNVMKNGRTSAHSAPAPVLYGGARGGGKASREFATVYDQLHKERLAVKREHLGKNDEKS